MAKKCISIDINPPIKTYQGQAFPLSVLFGFSQCCIPWLMSNFIQLIFKKDFSKFQYYDIDWMFVGEGIFNIYNYGFPEEFLINNLNDIILHIKIMIDYNCFAIGLFDEYFIPNRRAYKQYHFIHDYMLYGYDMDKQTFNIIGYNDKRKYKPTEISFKEYFNAIKEKNDKKYWIAFFSINKENKYEFDLLKFKLFIDDYLNSIDSSGYYKEIDYITGFKSCQYLIKYIDSITQNIDMRYICLFCEHKKNMLLRIKYLLENKYINNDNIFNDYSLLIPLTDNLKEICIKFNITQKNKLTEIIKSKIDEINTKEFVVLNQLDKYLKSI